jgi:CxxC-x17-CxxC domain-containing protein
MNNFRKPHGSRPGARPDRRSDSRPRFGAPARPRFGSDRREDSPKFDAVCTNCGKACTVPFRPIKGKPVYCKDCFDAPRDASFGSAKKAPSSFGEGKSIADLTRQVAAMNEKIDRVLKILEEAVSEEVEEE